MSNSRLSIPEVLAILEFVNQQHDADYRLVDRLPGGKQSGAYLLKTADEQSAILKVSPISSTWASQVHRAAQVISRLSTTDWPTPRWLAVGVTPDGHPYQVQEFVTGQPMTDLGPTEAELLIDLVDRQAGLDPDPQRDWSDYVRSNVFDGPDDGWARIRNIGVNGETILDSYSRLCRPYASHPLPTGDLVHGDMSTQNVLVSNGQITAVIDVEALGSGTRVIDLAALLREAYLWRGHPEAMVRLRRAGESIAGPEVLIICVTSTVLSVLDFVIRHSPHEISRSLRGALQLAEDLRGRLP